MKNKQRKKDRELCKAATDFVQFITKKNSHDVFTQKLVAAHNGLEGWATAYLLEKLETTHDTANAIATYLIDKTHQETKTA